MRRTTIAIGLLGLAVAHGRAEDWPTYGGNAARSGYTAQ